ncbi:hypothetical protein CCH79_00017641, partial [Gambusia affinis]
MYSHMAVTLSWMSYEYVAENKYKKESEVQGAGCLVHYILTDGQHPFQKATPYSRNPLGILNNVEMGNFTLQCEEKWSSQKDRISRMLNRSLEERPTVEEVPQAF